MDHRQPAPTERATTDQASDDRPTPAARANDAQERILARKVAVLVAKGKKTGEIAEALGISTGRVTTLKRSPLFQEMVTMIEEQITKSGVQDVIKDLMDDAPETLRFIKAVRDGDYDAVDAPILGQRMRAATWLGDRQLPAQKENVDRAVTLVIEGKLLNQIARAMKNDGAIDAEFAVVETHHPTTIEDMRAREAAQQEEEDDE